MPGCATRCTSFRRDTRDNAWLDIRDHFGPRTEIGSSRYIEDMNEWNLWAVNNSVDPMDATKFGNWLVWRCSFGTTEYGNLPTRKRDHEGISCIPCPYDVTLRSSETRTLLWTGNSGVVRSNHETDQIYYLQVEQRGNVWGFECTYSGCAYLLDNGLPYFHA